jgi:hypothetical protein
MLFWIILNNSARTAKKTPHFTLTKISRLTLFKEIIAVYCENRTEHVNNSYWMLKQVVRTATTVLAFKVLNPCQQ